MRTGLSAALQGHPLLEGDHGNVVVLVCPKRGREERGKKNGAKYFCIKIMWETECLFLQSDHSGHQ